MVLSNCIGGLHPSAAAHPSASAPCTRCHPQVVQAERGNDRAGTRIPTPVRCYPEDAVCGAPAVLFGARVDGFFHSCQVACSTNSSPVRVALRRSMVSVIGVAAGAPAIDDVLPPAGRKPTKRTPSGVDRVILIRPQTLSGGEHGVATEACARRVGDAMWQARQLTPSARWCWCPAWRR